ncbi:hypothetical protein AVEN_7101-1 [Araneus ventricosus]|uniref:Uncharacterized protein n=1 Tax=Araneus ventricosus TaxID=182803 RepID=A0A4Y2N502_ARAVE|nr:hypothetical protein AVEN_7101-1 [Araneus ventricosus]
MHQLSTEKIKAGIFDDPQIRQLIKDPAFLNSMNEAERKAWTSFVADVGNFLGKRKAENWQKLMPYVISGHQIHMKSAQNTPAPKQLLACAIHKYFAGDSCFIFRPWIRVFGNTIGSETAFSYLQEFVVPPVGGACVRATTVKHMTSHGGQFQGGGIFTDGGVTGHRPRPVVEAHDEQAVLQDGQAHRVHVACTRKNEGLIFLEKGHNMDL